MGGGGEGLDGGSQKGVRRWQKGSFRLREKTFNQLLNGQRRPFQDRSGGDEERIIVRIP